MRQVITYLKGPEHEMVKIENILYLIENGLFNRLGVSNQMKNIQLMRDTGVKVIDLELVENRTKSLIFEQYLIQHRMPKLRYSNSGLQSE